jgi:cell division transport system permease protein
VFVDNQDTASIDARGIPPFRRQLGVVFQDHKLLHDRPVADNVALPLVIAGVPAREIDKRVRAALDQVGLLGKERSRPLELSTGEQQRARHHAIVQTLQRSGGDRGDRHPRRASDRTRGWTTHPDRRGPGAGRVKLDAWLLRHAQTLVGSLGRVARQPVAACMTMGAIAVALALPLFFGSLVANTQAATADWNQAFDVSVYLKQAASLDRAKTLAAQLRKRPDVLAVRIISAEEALVQYRRASGLGSALDALDRNPLPHTLVVTPALSASSPAGTHALQAAIARLPDVDLVQVDAGWVEKLQQGLDILHRIIWIIDGLLSAGVVLAVGNTVRLDILNRRDEIEVMKLVGASNGFARRPFLYAGALYGLGGSVMALATVGLALKALTGPIHKLAGSYGSGFEVRGLGLRTVLSVVALSMGLGWLGSWLAATWHIRSIEPS